MSGFEWGCEVGKEGCRGVLIRGWVFSRVLVRKGGYGFDVL